MSQNQNKKQNNPNQSTSTDPFGRSSKLLRSPILNNKSSETHTSPVKENINEINKNSETHKSPEKENLNAILERLNTYEKMCESLQKQVDDLWSENQRLKESLIEKDKIDLPMRTEPSIEEEYKTDEEELHREIDWILKKKKKSNKRKRLESPEKVPSPKRSSKKTNLAKKPKPPPVILSNINDFSKVQQIMSNQNIKYEFKLLNNKQLSIKVDTEDDYRVLTKAMNDSNFEWHSYENKCSRPHKVIVRGLHPSCEPKYIQDDLKASGYQILCVTNIKMKKKENDNKILDSSPIFMLTFDHSEDIKKIFSIKHIVHTKVKIEAKRKQPYKIPQCKRCQRFEHTHAYCKREPRCVKCAGSHLTLECLADKTNTPKCCNCGQSHPASYRGCIVAKELQRKRSKNKEKPTRQKMPTPNRIKGVSYADVAKKKVFSGSASTQKQTKKPATPGKKSTTPKRHVPSKKTIPDQNQFITVFERMISKIEQISVRLEKIENNYANRHIGTPKSILTK